MNISHVGEFGLIEALKKYAPVSKNVFKGIGDDAAVLPFSKDKYLLFTTDMLAEDAHFTRRMKAEAIGHKAMACSISDIAAMGGLPTFAVVSIGLPKLTPVDFVRNIYKGMARVSKQFNVNIVGGDTVKSDKIVINVALLGQVEKEYLVTRSGAKPKDWIFVSGHLGGSLASGRHLTFIPRVAQARFLVQYFKPNAMMDISDGLAGDLNHILRMSKVGAKLWEETIPRHKGATLKQALNDGEDFELLFTLPAAKARRLMQWQAGRKAFYFYPIGEITANAEQIIPSKGHAHF
ncbi:MAG: thiamine-monophosphate kinase [Candidatus Omnitrophica bacterium]|nr:thiamine-monophosphate kinase [Candidatus Omnitrophota bacterium]